MDAAGAGSGPCMIRMLKLKLYYQLSDTILFSTETCKERLYIWFLDMCIFTHLFSHFHIIFENIFVRLSHFGFPACHFSFPLPCVSFFLI